MQAWDSELQRRQLTGRTGSAGAGGAALRGSLLLVIVLMAVGWVVAYGTPWPGLGAFLIVGALMAMPVVLIGIWLGI